MELWGWIVLSFVAGIVVGRFWRIVAKGPAPDMDEGQS